MLDHQAIAKHIPHHGTMCLLETVIAWNHTQLHALATSHRNVNNPLRNAHGLGASAGIEYAAQAMAMHGSLLAHQSLHNGSMPIIRPGRLASVRSTVSYRPWLHDVEEDLHIHVQQLMHDAAAMSYQFSVIAAGELLLEGRATVSLRS